MDRHDISAEDASHDVVCRRRPVRGGGHRDAARAGWCRCRSSWIAPSSRATPCRRTPSRGVVSCSWHAGVCSSESPRAARRRSARFRSTVPDGELVKSLKDSSGVDHLVAPRRHVLDMILLDAAREAGRLGAHRRERHGHADRRDGTRDRRDPSRSRRTARHVGARFVVGADGVRSRIARSVNAPVIDTPARERSDPIRLCRRTRRTRDSSSTSATDRSPASSRRTAAKRTSGSAHRVTARLEAGRDHAPSSICSSDCAPSLAERVRPPRSCRRCGRPSGSRTTCSRPRARDGRSSATPGTTATRSPATASPTRSATPSCSRHDRRNSPRRRARERRDGRPTSEHATARSPRSSTSPAGSSQFPPVDEFVELQKHLSALVDAEAAWLAAPPPLRSAAQRPPDHKPNPTTTTTKGTAR